MGADLLSVIRAVRRRWRLRLVLRGLAIALAGGFVAFLLATWGADRLRFAPTPLLVFRILAWGTFVWLAYRFLVRPLARRVSDEQVALYLEEHEPTLDGEVLSAVVETEPASGAVSPALVERIMRRAVERLDEVERGRRIERESLRRSGGMLAGATGAGLLLLLFGPASLRIGLPLLVSPLGGPESTPYAILVKPGDTTLARGADLPIEARLRNFTEEEVTLALRPAGATAWERVTMTLDAESGAHGVLLFDLRDSTDYFVTAGGIRSTLHRLAVTDLPYVDSIALEYHFPAYTGLAPLRQDEGGDVAALVGTRVRVEVVPTMPVRAGALAIGADTVPLRTDSAVLTGEIAVQESGSYRVLLAGSDGRLVPASPEYFIDALEDQPPTVRLAKPGRDMTVTSVDELFLEVAAEDDFGLTGVELVISVNGGPDTTVALYRGRGRLKEVAAGHTVYLEELGLQPGDVIAYYGRARDARRAEEPAATDIYFARIRPFDQRWRAAEASGGQQGGGGGVSPGELSQRQRDIVAATFRLVRDKAKYQEREWRDHLSTVTLMQGRLREEVETLVRRIESRGVVQLDSTMAAVAAALPPAVEAMRDAEERLGRRQGEQALPPEQRALQFLQRAEAAFRDRQVTRGQQGGGGGGQGEGADAEELAQLFELELDRLRNQYESVERGRREETSQEVDEALEKLRELARRQQQENQRLRAEAQGAQGAAGGAGQRRLAEQAEELARQLERLSREQGNQSLDESARRLREAADAMRRASAERGGTAQGSRALDRLSEARRRLENSRSSGLRRDLDDALRRADRLAEQQRRMREDVSGLPQAGQAREERLRRLDQSKEQMAEEVQQLESELDRLSREARGEQPGAADRLRETARAARDTRLHDKIRYSRGVARERSQEYADAFEEQIADDIEAMRQGIADAAGRIREGGGRAQDMERALDRTREIARGLESLGERARESGDSGAGAGAGAPDRQLRRELRERLGELRELRDQLRGQGADTDPLDGILERLGRMDNRGTVATPRGLDELEQAIVQGLKEYEFSLRRQLLGGDTPPGALSAGENVPPEYRAMVEEYYRRLSERRR